MKVRLSLKRAIAALAVVALAACAGGGGGGSSTVPTGSQTPSSNHATAKVIVTIGSSAETAAKKFAAERATKGGSKPQYVSPSTLGVQVTTSPADVSQAFDVSSGSPLCSSGLPRTCTLTFQVDPGSYTFTLDLYDLAPVSGTIPGSAHLLGVSTLLETIAPGSANTLNFYVGAVISTLGIGGGATFSSLPADGAAHSYGYVVVAQDADGNGVTGGTNDPYSTPITVTLAESGGSGHAHLVLNGTSSGASATLTHSSDTLSLAYDGGGTAGYTTQTTFAASGAPSANLQVSPLYASANSLTVYRPYDSGHPVSAALTINEASAPLPVAVNTSACGSKVNVTPASIPSGNGTATVAAGPNDAVSCTLTVQDAYGSSLAVAATVDPAYASGTIVTSYGGSLDDPSNLTLGSDGNIWFLENGIFALDKLNTTTGTITSTPINSGIPAVTSTLSALVGGCGGLNDASIAPWGMATGPDGNLWISGFILGAGCPPDDAVIAVSTAGTLAHAYVWAGGAQRRWYGTGGSPNYYEGTFVIGSDNNLWALACNGTSNHVEVTKLTTAGVLTEYASPVAIGCNGGFSNDNLIVGPDGNLWFGYAVSASSGGIMKVTTSGTMTPYPVMANNYPFFIASGSDGNIWYDAAPFAQGLYRMTTAGALLDSTPYVQDAGYNPGFIFPTFNGGIMALGFPAVGNTNMAGTLTLGSTWPAGAAARFAAAGTGVNDFQYIVGYSSTWGASSIFEVEP